MPEDRRGKIQSHPHRMPVLWRLLQVFNRHKHPVEMDDESEISPEDMKAARNEWDRLFRLASERTERCKIFDEMDTFGVVEMVLDIYAEEPTQPDYETRRTVWLESKNSEMVARGHECLQNVKTEDVVSEITRSMCKYGDRFQRLLYKTGSGVLGWQPTDCKSVTRLEDKFGRLIGFKESGQKFRGSKDRDVSWPWDYVHFRLMGREAEGKYGTSVLESLFRPWRQLALTEDSILMYRLRRAPDRNLVMVDVGQMEEHEAVDYVNRVRKRFRKHEYIDPASPQYRKQYNPLVALEDIFLAVRGPDSNTRIESLSGAGNVGEVYDLEYFVSKFFGTAHIPKAYAGFEGDINCFKLSTKIPCLDGRLRTLGQVIDEYEATGSLPWVYSYDEETRTVVPGEVQWAGVTKRQAEVVEVMLDDGTKHVCTPEHKWHTLSGEWVRADALVSGVQLHSYLNKERAGLVPVPNHTVISVQRLLRRYDTGDITVRRHHNFFIADAGAGGVLVHNSKATLMQQDIRFARTAKRIQRSILQGFRQLLDIHFVLLDTEPGSRKYDYTQEANMYVVQMSPIAYLDEWERLELIQLRYQIVEAMSRLASDLQLDVRVWAQYVLLNFAKLPEDLVKKLIARTAEAPPMAAGDAGGGFEHLDVGRRKEIRDQLLRSPFAKKEQIIQEVMGPMGSEGYYDLKPEEEKLLAEAVHTSPMLRKVMGDIWEYTMEDAMARQYDLSLVPPIVAGQVFEDTATDDEAAKQLREDLKSVGAKLVEG